MNLYTFFNAVASAVAQDAALGAWCRTHFGTAPDVRLDVPADNLPDIERGPYIQLGSPAKEMGAGRTVGEYFVEAELGFSLGTYKTRADGVSDPSGVELMCDFCEMALAAINADPPGDNIIVTAAEILTDTLGHDNDVYGLLTLTFTERLTIGTDRFT